MAVAGLDDAHAAHAVFAHFGMSYRRPLVLIRAMMAEIARASQQIVKVAPCCCLRMTPDEATLLKTVEQAADQPRRAHTLLGDLMGTADCLGVLTTAQAVGQAFADLGKPLALFASTAGDV
ncbi:hypothetical protein D3876_01280 [Sphingomonas cavernae]|uniref:Uncharacterized protein n=2 Tax=Sphingomonas cavernae TaxID=2320861 RepID=A0A418WSD7_9SPHN|nr:hypothetical protein D3876_01280 [Sphingomonas cavernae]